MGLEEMPDHDIEESVKALLARWQLRNLAAEVKLLLIFLYTIGGVF